MTADAPEAPPADPGLVALVQAAATHPDPWFSAVARSYLEPDPEPEVLDHALVARLEGQVAGGVYEPPQVEVEDAVAPGPHGPVPVRVYRPEGEGDLRPLLVWCHGGGFLGGDLDMPEADATSREVCARAGAVVVSVDYRLATRGVHFPVPHDDVVAAYDWALSSAASWGATGPAFVGGGSAGANLAAGVALRLRDEARPPAGVLLLYPLVHPALPPASEELSGRVAGLPNSHAFRAAGLRAVVENYLGAPASAAPPYAFAGVGDLRGYPATLIINCEYDGLRASGEAFAAALEAVEVPVTQLLAPDVLHGHINSPWLPQAQQSYGDMADWITARRYSAGRADASSRAEDPRPLRQVGSHPGRHPRQGD